MYDTQSSWNNHITSCINSYLQSQICIDPSIRDDSNDIGGNSNVIADDSRDIVINGNESSYFSRWIFEKDNGSNDNGEGSNDNGEESNDIGSNDNNNGSNNNGSNDNGSNNNGSNDNGSSDNDNGEGSNDNGSNNNGSNDNNNGSIYKGSNNNGSNDNNNGSIYKGSNNNGSIYNRSNDNGEGSNANPEPEGSNHNDPDSTQDYSKKYRHLWVQCEYCYALNYKRIFKSKMNICEQCGYHLKMSSSERIEGLIDPGTWDPMDEDMVSIDPIQWDEEDKTYKDRIDSYQIETGLTEAVQTGVGQLNGIPVAIGVMDFQFMGGSMGSVVGEKITRLIEYATNQFLPLIIVCASGGARMQEGSLSLMQMAKISSALYDYQSNKKLFYVSILTSPTTGGVTASFGMLGDIIIAEPNSYIAFAGKRVIEETLKQTVPEGSQETEYLFDKGLFDLIVPRTLLKDVLSELLKLHGFFPLNYTSIK
uniref:acetyl-CoA carboxylase beta subunit n=1 Tax=Campsis radicans TaxID=83937 RepID=UPI00240F4AD2|nr:acetyl-CoA carboxylase beta subunit [Campsis radicans]WES82123.1 acetyl-CoA carboxylase beta subunit [Campsis radicans]